MVKGAQGVNEGIIYTRALSIQKAGNRDYIWMQERFVVRVMDKVKSKYIEKE